MLGSDFNAPTSVTLGSGVASATVTLTPIDDAAVEGSGGVTVTLAAGSGYSVGPPASASGSIADNDIALPSLSIQSSTSILEGNNGTKAVTLTVTLSAASTQTVTVQYATANGTATAGSDYVAKTGTLTFLAGTLTQSITVTVNGDRTAEANETFTVTLSNAINATVATAVATVTITNDDGAALSASSAAPSGTAPATTLTASELDPVVAQAKAAWIAAQPTADFTDLSVSIGDLDGLLLGITAGKQVTIDGTAAGWGWTVSGGGMDLLTAVLHELGHVLGVDHDEVTGGLMGERLAPGSAHRLAGPAPAFPTVPHITASPPARASIGGGFRLGLAWLSMPGITAIKHSDARLQPGVMRRSSRATSTFDARLKPGVVAGAWRPGHSSQKPALTVRA